MKKNKERTCGDCSHWQCRSGILGECTVETPFWATCNEEVKPGWMVRKTETRAATCNCFEEKKK
jgi:positive regulator of sigma E activity